MISYEPKDYTRDHRPIGLELGKWYKKLEKHITEILIKSKLNQVWVNETNNIKTKHVLTMIVYQRNLQCESETTFALYIS